MKNEQTIIRQMIKAEVRKAVRGEEPIVFNRIASLAWKNTRLLDIAYVTQTGQIRRRKQ